MTVDSQGRGSAVFTAGPAMGAAQIMASLGGITVALPITVTSGRPARLEIRATPPVIPVGGQAVVTATVVDEGGSDVTDGVEVSFATTLGTVAPVTVTTQGGSAGTVLTSGVLRGMAVVQASVGGLTATVPVTIVDPSEPFTLTLAADPAQLRVDGSPGRLTATVADALGHPVADGTVVQFAVDRGTLSSPEAQTAGGQASVRLSPGIEPGDVQVTAWVDTVRGELVVPILADQATIVALDADPVELVAGYNNVSHLRADVRDRFGNPVADGTPVTFTVSLGRIADGTVLTSGGVAQADFFGELIAGTSAITATAAGGAQGFTRVAIHPGPPAQMTLSANPARVEPGGQVELVASVQDQYGNAVADGAEVDFHSSGGQLTPASAPVSDGVALARLEAPAARGRLNLVAQCELASAHASVDVLGFIYLPLAQQSYGSGAVNDRFPQQNKDNTLNRRVLCQEPDLLYAGSCSFAVQVPMPLSRFAAYNPAFPSVVLIGLPVDLKHDAVARCDHLGIHLAGLRATQAGIVPCYLFHGNYGDCINCNAQVCGQIGRRQLSCGGWRSGRAGRGCLG